MSWLAQYEQKNSWHDMKFTTLNVNPAPSGIVDGAGSDDIGQFTFKGTFSPNAPVCRVTKQYLGKHAIYYEGTYDGNSGIIMGHWGFEPGSKDGNFRMRRA